MTERGFLATLFDTSFSSFITAKFVRLLYVILILLIALGAFFSIFAITAALSEALPGVVAFVLALPMAAFMFFVYVILARIWLEIIIVIFRMAENLQTIADRGPARGGS